MNDPRTNITHEIRVGQAYTDSRTDDARFLIYVDRDVALLRDEYGHHHLIPRKMFDTEVGAGRYKLSDEPFGDTGRLDRVLARADEYEEQGGRKGKHYADALREAVGILTDTGSADAHEEVSFEDITGVGKTTATNLRKEGYRTRGDIRSAEDGELLDIGGVGEGNLSNIRQRVS